MKLLGIILIMFALVLLVTTAVQAGDLPMRVFVPLIMGGGKIEIIPPPGLIICPPETLCLFEGK